jgi:uncharacterized membrane protein
LTRVREINLVNLVITALFTALVCVATIIFSIYVPATSGFFNLGESMVFLSAILFGPFVGAFAGGVGSFLADLLLGYPQFAGATLLIKACEGAVVGTLMRKNPGITSRRYWSAITLILGALTGSLLGWVGTVYYSGELQLTLGSSLFTLNIPIEFWLFLGILAAVCITLLGLFSDPKFGWTVLSVILGGFTMVLGYFLYQRFLIYPLFNIEAIAIAEIPINIGQMIIGAIIALPISKVISRSLPYLGN